MAALMEIEDIRKMLVDVDAGNAPDNGFSSAKEAAEFWNKQSSESIMQKFDEYYGFPEAIWGDYDTEAKTFSFIHLMAQVNEERAAA